MEVTHIINTLAADAVAVVFVNVLLQQIGLPTATEAILKYNGTAITQEQVTLGFTFSAANKGLLTIDHISADQENPPDVSFNIKVTDDNATTPLSKTSTVNVALQPVNDNPVGTTAAQTIIAGQQVTIATTLLNASDVDTPAADLTFRLDVRPVYGYLYLSGVPLGEGATFTLSDITSGQLVYQHDGTALASDSFSVTLRDGEGGSDPTPLVVSFNINNSTDIPATAGNDSFSVLENIPGDIRSTTFSAAQLLINDSGNAPLTIQSVQSASNCSVVLNGDQTITFTPTTSFG